jgi:diguanylate cyclase (GGDEF)-like protein
MDRINYSEKKYSDTTDSLVILDKEHDRLYHQFLSYQKTQEQFEILFENINQGIVFCDKVYNSQNELIDASICSVNSKLKGLFTFDVAANYQLLSSLFMEVSHSRLETFLKFLGKIDKSMASTMINEIYFDKIRKWFQIDFIPMNQSKFALLMQDITQNKEYQLKIEELAYIDSLTGIPNRKMFFVQMEKIMAHAERTNQEFAIIYIDFNKFKAINDIFGHEVGDQVLKKGTEILCGSIRSEDIIARIGGDEFIVVMQDVKTILEIRSVVDRMAKDFIIEYDNHGEKVTVTLSLGIARYPLDGIQLEDLMHKADLAMYEAKKCKSNKYLFHNECCLE